MHNEELWKTADDFRTSSQLAGHEYPPIDVMYIADVILGIDIVPIKGLFTDIKRDAALNYDLSAIQVDEEAWCAWEARKGWVENRLRFTLAHELGHWVLHKDLIRQLGCCSMADYRGWAGSADKQDTPEYQANEFAGRFLVPLDILSAEFSQYQKQIAQVEPQWRQIEGMRKHLARKIAPRFGVNHQVIETRFDREGIWPVE